MHIGIVGGGFSGLLAAYLLKKKGHGITVYEKEEQLGGHCRSLSVDKESVELGTVFSFNDGIRSLLLELDVSFREQCTCRTFIDEEFSMVEQLTRAEVARLLEELARFERILARFSPGLDGPDYGAVHQDLAIPVGEFLRHYDLPIIAKILAPHLSAYGFGGFEEVQAYYAFSIFKLSILYSFLRGEKLLFMDRGFADLISRLASNVSDIRYGSSVISVERAGDRALIRTDCQESRHDRVLISARLPADVVKDRAWDARMRKIRTNPYFVCVYEAENRGLVTSYFRANLAKASGVQFFHTWPRKDGSVIAAYAYGVMGPSAVREVGADLERSGVRIRRLVCAKQWQIFPHLDRADLTPTFYSELAADGRCGPISFIGSLVAGPSISNLYESVKGFVEGFPAGMRRR